MTSLRPLPLPFLALAFALLAGCGEEPDATSARVPAPKSQADAPAPARTVMHLLENPDEHDAITQRCKDNPGSLANTPDCINAAEARKRIFTWGRDEALKRISEEPAS